MPVDATKRTIDAYLESLLNGGDFAQFFTDQVEWTTMETGDKIQGRDAVRDFIVALHSELFDARPEFKRVVVDDGIAALEADFVGTHTGEFAGIPPTGASVRVSYCVVYDLTDAGITALRAYMPVRQIIAELQAASDR
jgi:predicted ester cyclase